MNIYTYASSLMKIVVILCFIVVIAVVYFVGNSVVFGNTPSLDRILIDGLLADDQFGNSVDIDESNAVIGSFLDDNASLTNSGAAYALNIDPTTGAWTSYVKLMSPEQSSGDYFGGSVAVDSGVIFVGAYGDDYLSKIDSGSVFTFRKNTDTWDYESKIMPNDSSATDLFGYSVAADGGYLVVGAPRDDDKGKDSGSAYIFKFNGTAWIQEAKLVASDGGIEDAFGTSVDIDNGRIIVGSKENTHSGKINVGAAYVFRLVSGTWTQEAKLTNGDLGKQYDYFGTDVSIDDERIVVAAKGFDLNATVVNVGAVYSFTLNNGEWILNQRLLNNNNSNDWFGNSISLDGSYLAVSCLTCDVGSNTNAGKIEIFYFSDGTWENILTYVLSDRETNDRFGSDIEITNNRVIVGARTKSKSALVQQTGAAYLLELSGLSLNLSVDNNTSVVYTPTPLPEPTPVVTPVPYENTLQVYVNRSYGGVYKNLDEPLDGIRIEVPPSGVPEHLFLWGTSQSQYLNQIPSCSFSFGVRDIDGNDIENFTFKRPVRLDFPVDIESVFLYGVDSFAIQYFDNAINDWRSLNSSLVDLVGKKVFAYTSTTGTYRLSALSGNQVIASNGTCNTVKLPSTGGEDISLVIKLIFLSSLVFLFTGNFVFSKKQ